MSEQEKSYPKIWSVDASGELITTPSGNGTASAENQATQIGIEEEIRDRLPSALIGNRLPVDADTGIPITGATIPTGGTGIIGWLSGIWKLISDRVPTVGTKNAANSIPVTLANDGAFAVNFGAATDSAATSDISNLGFLSLFKRLLSVTLLKGQSTMANSISMSVASDQTAIPATIASLPLPLNAASSTDIQQLTGILESLMILIARPLWVNPTNSNVNCNIANGTLPLVTTVNAVTTVSTVTNTTQFGTQPIQNTLLYDNSRIHWIQSTRGRIS